MHIDYAAGICSDDYHDRANHNATINEHRNDHYNDVFDWHRHHL